MQNLPSALCFFLFMVGLSSNLPAQNFTSSPYSRFGIGEVSQPGFGRNKAMGGTGIALRSYWSLNDVNPASYTKFDSISNFLFEFGGIANFASLKTEDASTSTNTWNFEYLAFGFPIKKWWGASLGIRKMSDIGYDLELITNDDISGTYTEFYSGTGGLNKVYMSHAFQYKNVSFGLNINYLWGKISLYKSLDIASGIDYQNSEELRTGKLTVGFGVQYEGKLNEKQKYVVGVTFDPKTDITGEYEEIGYQLYSNNPDTANYTFLNSSALELPTSYGIGFAITHNKKLTLAFDYLHRAWADVAFFGDMETLKNSNRIALGAEYIPNVNAIKGYFNRVSYRAGAYYNSSYLELNGKSINDYGITLGAGLPIKSTYLNLALQVGQKGTIKNGLIKENYVKFSMNFTLFEAWFRKILYD